MPSTQRYTGEVIFMRCILCSDFGATPIALGFDRITLMVIVSRQIVFHFGGLPLEVMRMMITLSPCVRVNSGSPLHIPQMVLCFTVKSGLQLAS